jgi:hypothetical protein
MDLNEKLFVAPHLTALRIDIIEAVKSMSQKVQISSLQVKIYIMLERNKICKKPRIHIFLATFFVLHIEKNLCFEYGCRSC